MLNWHVEPKNKCLYKKVQAMTSTEKGTINFII